MRKPLHAVAEQRLLGPFDYFAFGAPMINKTPKNVVGYFMIFVVFSFLIMGIILDFKVKFLLNMAGTLIEENFVKVLAIFYCGTSTIICGHH